MVGINKLIGCFTSSLPVFSRDTHLSSLNWGALSQDDGWSLFINSNYVATTIYEGIKFRWEYLLMSTWKKLMSRKCKEEASLLMVKMMERCQFCNNLTHSDANVWECCKCCNEMKYRRGRKLMCSRFIEIVIKEQFFKIQMLAD